MAVAKKAASKKTGASDKDAKTRTKIERLAKDALKVVEKGDNPALEIRMRALSNVSFNEKRRIIELGDKVAVTSCNVQADAAGSPEVTLGIAFAKITWKYKTDKDLFWDLKKNEGSLKAK